MRKNRVYVFALIALWSQAIRPASAVESSYTILYFFTSTCPHCKNSEAIINDLSKEYTVQGLLYGKGNGERRPYEVREGDQAASSKYGVQGVPSLVVLKDDKFRLKIAGEHNIKDAPVILKAFRKGALTVSEAIETMPREEIIVTGWVNSRGDYFDKNTKFSLTDRQRNIYVGPWLPLEAVKSRFKKTRPRLMSDVIGKPVALKGKIVKTGTGFQFSVKEEVIIE